MKTKDDGRYLKTTDASKYLGVSPRYMRELMSQGRIAFSRIGPRCQLLKRSDLDAFVEHNMIHAI